MWVLQEGWKLGSRPLTLKRLGEGQNPPPPDISRNMSATRKAITAAFHDFVLPNLAHLLTPNLRRPGTRFRSYVTFCTCMSHQKSLKNVILCTISMQIVFSAKIHKCMIIFTFADWNKLIFGFLGSQKCPRQISRKKQ